MPSRRGKRPPTLPYAARDPSALRIEVQRLDPTHALMRVGPHGHSFFELLYVRRGHGAHRIGAKTIATRAGDLFVLAPGEVHDARGLTSIEGWLVLFTADALTPASTEKDAFVALPGELLLSAFLRPRGDTTGHYRLARAAEARWDAACAALHRELADRALGYHEAARAHLTLLLVEVARLVAPRLAGVTVSRRPLLADVFRFVEARFAQPISLVDVAKAVGRSPAYLTDLVKRETGRTVQAWIIERRMAEARRRLIETDDEIGSIAEAAGYDDPSYFTRQFRRLHGTTPLAFRAARR